MNNPNKKGFTLIEMAVVLLIIGILAGIVLRNIGTFSPAARDTRRVANLNTVGTYLAQYSMQKGYFPTSNSWDQLETELKSIGVSNLPRDPGSNQYYYFYCTSSGAMNPNHFILRAQLEQSSTTNPKIYENSYNSSSAPSGWSCSSSTIDCSNNSSNYFCLAQ